LGKAVLSGVDGITVLDALVIAGSRSHDPNEPMDLAKMRACTTFDRLDSANSGRHGRITTPFPGSLARRPEPGGNVTGVTDLQTSVVTKRLGLLHELVPAAKVIGILVSSKG
jgi:hypothetical protein